MPPPSADDKAVLQLEQDWNDAVAKHDAAFLQRALADEYIYTDPTGHISGKAAEIARAQSGDVRIESYQLSDERVRVYGDNAVLTGAIAIKGLDKTASINGNYRWTDLFVRHAGAWQVAASQATQVRDGDD